MRKYLTVLIEAIKGTEKNFTTGSINRAIVFLSIPMILEMVMESLFALVDTIFVSRISTEAVATVGLTESVVTLVYSIGIGLSMAATAMVARRVGEGDPEKAALAGAQSIIIALIISVIIGIIGILFAEDILRLMGADENVIQTGKGYTRILIGSNVVIMLLFLLNGIFRGAGDAALAMRSLWVANILNIILDPLFIFGIGPFPELGVQGAAVATTIGRSVGVMYQLHLLFGKKSIVKLARKHFTLAWDVIKRLLDIAATGTGQFLIASASWIFLMKIISLFGSEAIAGYTISIRLIIFTILPSWGLANAAATLVGQNLGAGQPERAEISVWKAAHYNMIFLLTVSIIYFISAPYILQYFDPNPGVIKAGVTSLRIICIGYVFFAYGMVIGQAFNGAGDTRTPTVINLICFWAIQIPLGYFLAVELEYGLAGVCAAIGISETILALLAIMIFRRGKWKLVKI
jgi:putative MATE family efflux protein